MRTPIRDHFVATAPRDDGVILPLATGIISKAHQPLLLEKYG